MTPTTMTAVRARDEARLLAHGPLDTFTPAELDGLPAPVQRYLRRAIAPGTPLVTGAVLRMRGHIKIGRWLPFRAREVLAPQRGFVWAARAAGIIAGSDRYIDGRGGMRWKLCGMFPVMVAGGPDVARSAAGRAGAEALWLPTALLPRHGAQWEVQGSSRITARLHVDDVPVVSHLVLDDDGAVTAHWCERWGDPDGTGSFGWHAFGGEVTAHRTFGGLTIPSAGLVGWRYGADRWPSSAFFRYEITALEAAI